MVSRRQGGHRLLHAEAKRIRLQSGLADWISTMTADDFCIYLDDSFAGTLCVVAPKCSCVYIHRDLHKNTRSYTCSWCPPLFTGAFFNHLVTMPCPEYQTVLWSSIEYNIRIFILKNCRYEIVSKLGLGGEDGIVTLKQSSKTVDSNPKEKKTKSCK